MDMFRRTRSDRVQPLSSTVTVSLNTFTPWQWPKNDEMQLQVCRPQMHGRKNPALVKWNLSNKLTYAERFVNSRLRTSGLREQPSQGEWTATSSSLSNQEAEVERGYPLGSSERGTQRSCIWDGKSSVRGVPEVPRDARCGVHS